jgi:hypothetical protein
MKKKVFGLAILMLLIGYIGWEMAATDETPSSSSWAADEAAQPTETVLGDSDITDGHLIAQNDALTPAPPGVAAFAPNKRGSEASKSDAYTAPAANASTLNTTEPGIYVFHGKSIIASEKPSESEKSRLQHSIALATKTLRQPFVVLDADALSLSGAPHVLFAKDQFDLTELIKTSYSNLDDTSSITKEMTQSQQNDTKTQKTDPSSYTALPHDL